VEFPAPTRTVASLSLTRAEPGPALAVETRARRPPLGRPIPFRGGARTGAHFANVPGAHPLRAYGGWRLWRKRGRDGSVEVRCPPGTRDGHRVWRVAHRRVTGLRPTAPDLGQRDVTGASLARKPDLRAVGSELEGAERRSPRVGDTGLFGCLSLEGPGFPSSWNLEADPSKALIEGDQRPVRFTGAAPAGEEGAKVAGPCLQTVWHIRVTWRRRADL